MGCGIVCGVTQSSDNKHANYSQTKLQYLLPRIKISPPLLTDKLYRKFS